MKSTYEHNLKNSKEIAEAWFNNKAKKINIIIYIFIVLLIIAMIFSFQILYLLFFGLLLIVKVVYIKKRKDLVNMEGARLKVIYKDKPLNVTVELDDKIHLISNKSQRVLEYSDILEIIQSKNFIVLVVKGQMTIAINKNNFETGSAKECLKLLKEKLNLGGN
ncbi:MAG: YcxB family protein [Mycoplasmatota bacterium]